MERWVLIRQLLDELQHLQDEDEDVGELKEQSRHNTLAAEEN